MKIINKKTDDDQEIIEKVSQFTFQKLLSYVYEEFIY